MPAAGTTGHVVATFNVASLSNIDPVRRLEKPTCGRRAEHRMWVPNGFTASSTAAICNILADWGNRPDGHGLLTRFSTASQTANH